MYIQYREKLHHKITTDQQLYGKTEAFSNKQVKLLDKQKLSGMESTSDTIQASSKAENTAKDIKLLNFTSQPTARLEKVMQPIYFL